METVEILVLDPRRYGFIGFVVNLVDLRRPSLRRSLMWHVFGNAMVFRTTSGAMEYANQVCVCESGCDCLCE